MDVVQKTKLADLKMKQTLLRLSPDGIFNN